MQSLGENRGLPRLISGRAHDAFGGVRPGNQRSVAPLADRLGVPSGPRHHNTGDTAPGSGSKRNLIAVAIICVVGVVAFNLPPVVQGKIRHQADRIAINAGLGVDHVAIIGHVRTPLASIVRALDLNDEKSLIGFSASEVRARLKTLPWVATARVMHILPDTVSIEITEREPFALWQHSGQAMVIDRDGHVLGKSEQLERKVADALPLVIGKGAANTASAFQSILRAHPRVMKRVVSATRVADRRWNLKFNTGEKILLPEQRMKSAFVTLDYLLASQAFEKVEVRTVDLRIPARPTLRLSQEARQALAKVRRKNFEARIARQGS